MQSHLYNVYNLQLTGVMNNRCQNRSLMLYYVNLDIILTTVDLPDCLPSLLH